MSFYTLYVQKTDKIAACVNMLLIPIFYFVHTLLQFYQKLK